MALFGSKKAKPVAAPASKSEKSKVVNGDFSRVLLRPRITEKAALLGENNVYVFDIARRASKEDVINAVRKLFNVTPVKVTIVHRAPRRTVSRARNRETVVHGYKKANVFLKKDDRINLV